MYECIHMVCVGVRYELARMKQRHGLGGHTDHELESLSSHSDFVSAAAGAGRMVVCRGLHLGFLTHSFSLTWSQSSDPLLMESSAWPE